MDLEIVERDKNRLKLLVHGATHTFLNVLRDSLKKEKAEIAAYTIGHPMVPKPTLLLETKKKKPERVLRAGAERVRDMAAEFMQKFKKSLR